MDNELRFIVSLKDNASHQAKRIQNNLGAFNRTYTSNIRLNLIDNISHRLRGIFSMLGGEGGFTRLFSFDSPSIKNGIKKLGSSISSIFKSDDNKKWFEKTVGYFKEAEKYAVRFGSSLVTAFAIGGAGIVAGFGVASAVLSKQLIKINSEMEQFEISLQTTLGSLTAAKQEMAGIVEFAKETPYEIKQVTDAVVKLRAYSMDSDKWLEPLGNAASAFGRDITDAVEMAADAVQGMFRRALSYGIRMDREMFKQGGKYAGMTYAEALMMELEKRFKGGMELQAKTLKGIWSNLKDTLYIQFQEATSPIYGIIKKQVQNLYEYLGSEQGQAKLRQLFKTMSSFIAKFIEIGKQVFSFIKASIVPIVQTVGKAMIRTFMTISEMLEPLKALLEPFISALTSVLTIVSKIITANETLLKIFVGYVVATRIMKMLGFSVGKLAANMVATNKAATMLGATISTLGKLAFGLGAAFVGMWTIGSYLEVRNNLKEIGVHIHNFALGADEVKQHLKEISEETGKTLKDMTKIALAAKQFGHNMGNVIEQSAKAAGKAREGLPKNLGDFGLDEEAITEAIGTLAEALIAEGDSFETMKRKTEEAGDTLANLMRLSELTGLSFEDLAIAISNNGTTVERYADKIKDLQYLMVQFGIAAKQLGKDVSPDKFLQALEMLYTPTQEMLLELPLGTWIAKNLSEMDIDAISKNLSGILNPTEVERVITKFGDTARKILDKQSIVFLENIQDSATVFVDATEQAKDNVMAMSNKLVQSSIDFSKNIASASGLAGKEGAGGSDTEQLGLWGRFLNGIYSHWEVATAVTVAAIAGLAVLNRLNLQVARRTEKAIVGIAAEPPSTRLGKTIKDSMSKVGMDQEFFRNRYVKMEEKLIAKALPKNMLGRIETAIELQTKQMMKDWKEEFKSLERDLKVTRDAYNRGILSQVMKAGFGGGEKAVPPGMTPEEFLTRFPEEAFKNMSELEIEVFEIWKEAFTEQIARLEDELSESRAKALDKIRQMTESYNELANAIKKGRIPSRFKDMIKEIKDLTKNMEIAGDKFNLFGRKAKAAAETTTERGMAPTQRQVTPIRKAILFGLLSVLDLRGWKMTFASFKKGMNLKTIRESLLGVTRIIGDFLVLTKNNMEAVFKAAVGRASSLTIGRLSGRAMGRVRGFFTGRVGIVPEGMQGGYFQPGANEQFRWKPMVDYLKKIYNTLLGKQKGVLTVLANNVKEMAYVPKELITSKLAPYKQIPSKNEFSRTSRKLGSIEYGVPIISKSVKPELRELANLMVEAAETIPLKFREAIELINLYGTVSRRYAGLAMSKGSIGYSLSTSQVASGEVRATSVHEMAHVMDIGDFALDELDMGDFKSALDVVIDDMAKYSRYLKRGPKFTEQLTIEYLEWFNTQVGLPVEKYLKSVSSNLVDMVKAMADVRADFLTEDTKVLSEMWASMRNMENFRPSDELIQGREPFMSNRAISAGLFTWADRAAVVLKKLAERTIILIDAFNEVGVEITTEVAEKIVDGLVKNIDVTGKNLGDAFVTALFKNFENIKVEALVGNRLVSLMDVLTYIFEAKAKVYAGELSGRIYIETRDALWKNFFKAATRQLPAGPAESVVTTAQSTSTALEKVGSRAVERISSVAQASVEVINESGEVIKQLSSSAVKEIEGVARKALPPASGTDIVKAQTDLVKAGSRALVKFERTNLPTARARMIYPPFSYEIIRDSTNQLSKDIKEGTKATKAQAAWLGAMVLSMADSLGTQYLEPYFQKLIDQGSMWGAVGMTAYKTFMPTEWPIIGDTIRELGNSALMLAALLPSVAPVAIPLAYAGTGVGSVAGMLGKLAGGGALERGVDISYDLETWYEEATFQIGKLMVEGTEQLGHGIKEALITAADYVEKGFIRINSLVHGGGGKIPEFEAELTEKIWGTEAAEYEKEIEKQFDRYKDVKVREEAYAKLHEQKVLAYTEETTRKREFMLEVLANITKENYRVLEEAGKTASQPLIDELDRANKWVKENIFAGTDLATQEAVAKMVTEFQKGSQLAVEVYTSTLEGMLEGFDLETPEGVKHFLEEMAKMKGDAEAGQIALDMMIVAMQKTQDEIDRVAAQIAAWNEELEELNRQISEANSILRDFDQQLVGLNQAFTNVTTALDLAIARNELELVSESAQNLEYEIAQLAVELSTAEYQMLPLQKALNQTEKEFDAIQDAIDKTQQKLDDFMNAPIEGEGAYREQRYQIEQQIKRKEHELELAKKPLEAFEKHGLTGSDTYKAAATNVANLEKELSLLQTQLNNLEYNRELITDPVEHAKEMSELAQQGAEQAAQAIIDGIKLESDKLVVLQQQAEEKQKELNLAQSLVDKKQEEIDGITDAMGLKEKELDIIQKQVEADNKLVQNLKDKLTAEQKIRDLSAQIVKIDSDHLKMQGLVSAQKLQQLTIEYALGNVGKEGLLAISDMYTKVGTQIADITGQKTPYANEVAYLNFDVEGLAEKIAAAEKENEARAAIRDALYEAIKQGIGDIDIEALSRSDLESVFGGNIGDIVSRMGQNIAIMANKQSSEKAVGYRNDWFAQVLKNMGVATYASGGIELAQQSLAMLHGPEAIIPLQNGAVPVTLYGAGTQGGGETVVNHTKVEIGSIVVRDNEDLEEIKGAILALRQGQVNFFSRASQYPERF